MLEPSFWTSCVWFYGISSKFPILLTCVLNSDIRPCTWCTYVRRGLAEFSSICQFREYKSLRDWRTDLFFCRPIEKQPTRSILSLFLVGPCLRAKFCSCLVTHACMHARPSISASLILFIQLCVPERKEEEKERKEVFNSFLFALWKKKGKRTQCIHHHLIDLWLGLEI